MDNMKTKLFTKLMAVALVLAFAVSLIPSVGADELDDHIKVLSSVTAIPTTRLTVDISPTVCSIRC